MFEEGATLKQQRGEENVLDFTLGNPYGEPPPALAEEMARLAASPPPGLHKYMSNAGYPEVRTAVARDLARMTGLPFTGELVVMTVGRRRGAGRRPAGPALPRRRGDRLQPLSSWSTSSTSGTRAASPSRSRRTNGSSPTCTPSRRRSPRGPGRSSSTRRTTRPGRSTPRRRSRPSTGSCRPRDAGSGPRSTRSPTSRTGRSSSGGRCSRRRPR